MRYLLTLLIGCAIGFGLANWEAVRDVVNADRIASITSKVGTSSVSDGEDVVAESDDIDVRALASAARVGSDLTKVDGIANLFVQNEQGPSLQSVNQMPNGLRFHAAAFVANASDDSGQNGGAADASEEIAFFEEIKGALAAENQLIEEILLTLDPQHPQYSLLSCFIVGNESLMGLQDFWIQVAKDQSATDESVATLAQVFNDNRKRVEAMTETGRGAALGYSLVLRVLPAKTETDRQIKTKSLEMLDTYPFAFDVEDAMAAHNLDFIAMLDEPVASEEAAIANLEAWSVALTKLVEARMSSQMEREQLAAEILAIAPTS